MEQILLVNNVAATSDVSPFEVHELWSPFYLMQNQTVTNDFVDVSADPSGLSAHIKFGSKIAPILDLVGDMTEDVAAVWCAFAPEGCQESLINTIDLVGETIKGMKDIDVTLAFQAEAGVKIIPDTGDKKEAFDLQVTGDAFALSNVAGVEYVAVSTNDDAGMGITLPGIRHLFDGNYWGFKAHAAGDIDFVSTIYEEIHLSASNSTEPEIFSLVDKANWQAAEKVSDSNVKVAAIMDNQMRVEFTTDSQNGTMSVSLANAPADATAKICFRSFNAHCSGSADYETGEHGRELHMVEATQKLRELKELKGTSGKIPLLAAGLLNANKCTAPVNSALQCTDILIGGVTTFQSRVAKKIPAVVVV